MGKKTRKTRWRTLSINGPHSDSEDTSLDAGRGQVSAAAGITKPYQNGTSRQHDGSTHSTPTRHYRLDARGNRTTNATNGDNKITFNEDEYTRITTPRQDVLFKKGYLNRPKSYASSAGGATGAPLPRPGQHSHCHQHPVNGTSTGNSTGNGTPDHQSADGTEGTDPEFEQPPFVYPNSYIDNGNIYFINSVPSFEPYPMVMYNTAPVCYPPPFRVKRYSTDSMTESTSPNNEHQDGLDELASNPPDFNPVFNFVYPGFYYANDIYHSHDAVGEGERAADPRRLKKKRRLRKVSRSKACNEGATDSCGEEYSSEDEPASPSECSTDQSDGVKLHTIDDTTPTANGHAPHTATPPPQCPAPVHDAPIPSEGSRVADQPPPADEQPDCGVQSPAGRQSPTVEANEPPSATSPDKSTDAPTHPDEQDAPSKTEPIVEPPADGAEGKTKYRVEAEEFVPRAYRQPSFENHLPVTNFIPLPIINDIYPPNFTNAPFMPPGVPINFIRGVPHYEKFIPGYMPPNQYYINQPDYYVNPGPSKEDKQKGIDITKIVSKLEEAAIEQNKAEEETSSDTKPAKTKPNKPKAPKKLDPPTEQATDKPKPQPPSESKPEPPKPPAPKPPSEEPKKPTKKVEVPAVTKYSETLKKHLKKPVVKMCPRLDRTAKLPEATPAKPTTTYAPVAPKPEPKSADQWISVSNRKKRKNKTMAPDEFFDDMVEPPYEPVPPVPEPVPEPVIEPVIEPIVEPTITVEEVQEAKPEKKPKKDKLKTVKKRVMINDSALINNKIIKPETPKSKTKPVVDANPTKRSSTENKPKKEAETTKKPIARRSKVASAPVLGKTKKRIEATVIEPEVTIDTKEVVEELPEIVVEVTPPPEEPVESVEVVVDETQVVEVDVVIEESSEVIEPVELVEVPVVVEVPEKEAVEATAESSEAPVKASKSPDSKSKKKKKKSKSGKSNAGSSAVEDGFDLLTDDAAGVASRTNVEVSLELDRLIQRGLYANLEQKIKSVSPGDSFIAQTDEFPFEITKSAEPSGFGLFRGLDRLKSFDLGGVLFNSTMNKTLQKAMISKLATEREKKTSESSDVGARGDFLDKCDRSAASAGGAAADHTEHNEDVAKDDKNAKENKETKEVKETKDAKDANEANEVKDAKEVMDAKPYPITKAVKDWMDRTRETTPDVEILKSVDVIRQEFFLTDSDGDSSGEAAAATTVTASRDTTPDLLECWDDSGIELAHPERPVDVAEDVLQVYESVYGSNQDYRDIQDEVNAKRRFPRDAGLPYRAICCTLM